MQGDYLNNLIFPNHQEGEEEIEKRYLKAYNNLRERVELEEVDDLPTIEEYKRIEAIALQADRLVPGEAGYNETARHFEALKGINDADVVLYDLVEQIGWN